MIAGALELQLFADVARIKSDMDKAQSIVGSAMSNISRSVEMAKNAIGLLGIAASVGGLAALAKGAIESAAAMHSMSERTGVSVQALGAFRSAAKLSNTDMNDVATGLQKLSKNMVDAQVGVGKSGQAFKALGVSVTDGNGKLKTADQMMLDVAKAMKGFEQGAGLTAAAIAIFGKAGANLMPVLIELAERGTTAAKITAEQAKQAHEFERQMAQLKATTDGFVRTAVLDMLPFLMKLPGLLKLAVEAAVTFFAIFVGAPALFVAAKVAFDAFAVAVYSGFTTMEIAALALNSTLFTIGPTFAAMTASAGVFGTAVLSILGVLAAAFFGWKLGEWLYENFLTARLAGIAFVDGTLKGWEAIKYGAAVAWAYVKSAANEAFKGIGIFFAGIIEDISRGLAALGQNKVADLLQGFADGLRNATKNSSSLSDETAKLKSQYDASKKSIDDLTGAMADEAIQHFAATAAAEGHKKTIKDVAVNAKEAAAELKRYEAAVKSLSDKLGKAEEQSETEKLAFELYGKAITMADGTVVHLTGNLEKLTPAHKAVLPVLAKEIDTRKGIQAALAAEITNRTALEAVLLRGQAITNDARAAMKDEIEQYQFETSLIGKTAEQIVILSAQRKIDLDYKRQLKALGDVYQEGGPGLDAAIAKLDTATQALRDGLIPEIVKRNQLERDWATGSTAAYNEYIDNATNAARQAKDAWTNAFKGMEDMLTNFFTTGKLDFKSFITLIEQQLARLAAQQFVINIVGNVGGSAASGAIQGGASSLMGGGGLLGSLGSVGTVGGQVLGGSMSLGNGAGTLFANATTSGSGTSLDALLANNGAFGTASTVSASDVAAAAAASDVGGGAAAAGTVDTAVVGAGAEAGLAAIPVYGWIALAALAIYSMVSKSGETRSGGQYENGQLVDHPSGGEINGDATRTAIGATMGSINSLISALGGTATLTRFVAGSEESKEGKGFAYAGGNLSNGATFGQGFDGQGFLNRRGSMTNEEATAALGDELKQATLQALQAADVPGILGDYLKQLGDVDKLSGGALDAALGRITKALTEKQQLEDKLYDLTATDLEKLNKQRDAERAAIDESNKALLERVYALQDEQAITAAVNAQIGTNLSAAATALADARKGELSAVQDTSGALKSSIDRFRTLASTLRDFRDSLLLGDLSPLTPAQKYAAAAAQFSATNAAALGGDADAMGRLQSVSQDFLQASQTYNASSDAYLADFAKVQAALTLGASKADALATSNEAQLAVLNAQLSSLNTINSSVLTIPAALAQLGNAVSAALSAGINPGAGNIGALTNGVTGSFVNTAIGSVYASSAGAAVTGGKLYTVGGQSYTLQQAQEYIYGLVGAGRKVDAYNSIKAFGITLAEADVLVNQPAGTIEDWARASGLPVFHNGIDFVPETGLALLERGERVTPRSQNGSGMDAVVAELREIKTTQVQQTRALAQVISTANASAADKVVEGTANANSRAAFTRAQAADAKAFA